MFISARLVLTFTLGAAAWCAAAAVGADDAGAFEEKEFIDRARPITLDGLRAGEGYFSPDGNQLVFQSERRAENPFYQIYLLDLQSGDVTLVSPGSGKTTCAFFRPDGRGGATGEILYASTHHDPTSLAAQSKELAARAAGTQRRYAWDYDPEMELYVTDLGSQQTRRLTEARGYDAEASYSPDGQWIVFSSTRTAYQRSLTAEEQKRLEVDPSYFGELYRVRADGSGLERLTTAVGYDGGPFFFPDGARIIWRRFDQDGVTADVYSARPDGSDERRLTTFGALSWAPYVHPSGAYVLFASNKLGFDNFEIFMVDTAGTREPVRITTTPGFDGLPVPSPDGTQLAWTSNRHDGKGGQLYLGRWNHARALAALEQAPPRALHAARQEEQR